MTLSSDRTIGAAFGLGLLDRSLGTSLNLGAGELDMQDFERSTIKPHRFIGACRRKARDVCACVKNGAADAHCMLAKR